MAALISNCESSSLLIRAMSKRRTWLCLFVSIYTIILSLSWNLFKSVLYWYELESTLSPGPLPALYASVLLGLTFGVLSTVAALAVAVPATVVAWITVIVLLTFCGTPRNRLVVEGNKLTAEITGFMVKVLIKEGNVVAAVCAVIGYFALLRNRDRNGAVDATFVDFH